MINTSRVIEEKFYEYVEERNFSDCHDPALSRSAPSRQRRILVISEDRLDGNEMPPVPSVQYMTYRTEALEEIERYPPEEGTWGINLSRSMRYWGHVDEEVFPYGIPIKEVPADVETEGKRY